MGKLMAESEHGELMAYRKEEGELIEHFYGCACKYPGYVSEQDDPEFWGWVVLREIMEMESKHVYT